MGVEPQNEQKPTKGPPFLHPKKRTREFSAFHNCSKRSEIIKVNPHLLFKFTS